MGYGSYQLTDFMYKITSTDSCKTNLMLQSSTNKYGSESKVMAVNSKPVVIDRCRWASINNIYEKTSINPNV